MTARRSDQPTLRHLATDRRDVENDGARLEIDNKSLTPGDCVSRREAFSKAGRLNALFANSVNSPSMSMVNFSCCVRSTPDVTRKVTAQPMLSAVRMEVGVHAGV